MCIGFYFSDSKYNLKGAKVRLRRHKIKGVIKGDTESLKSDGMR